MVAKIIVFLLLNFSALGLGSLFTSDGVASEWYTNLNKAPWTPPGWVFGSAWTFIMICFAVYMAYLWTKTANKKSLIILYTFQWVLNVLWNPVFFYLKQTEIGLIMITALTLLIGFLLFRFRSTLTLKSWLIAPYLIWLIIATSLNAYVVFYN